MRRLLASVILLAGLSGAASAQQFYLGEILAVGFNYCPKGSTPANGSTMPVQQNPPLFALYGTTYGGNGTTTFGLPKLNLRTHSNQVILTCVVTQGTYPPRP